MEDNNFEQDAFRDGKKHEVIASVEPINICQI